ncbi:Exopolygalacturonase, partial [Cucurbita argyrosperma subsp. sororia]
MSLNSSDMGCLVFFIILLSVPKCYSQSKEFNIIQFGAIADGKTDSTKALSEAWKGACGHNGYGIVLVPEGSFLVLPLVLEGPCKGSIGLHINGELLAPVSKNFATGEYWLSISDVDNFFVDGSGSLNGGGSSAWQSDTSNRPISNSKVQIRDVRYEGIKGSSTSQVAVNFECSQVLPCQGIVLQDINLSLKGDGEPTSICDNVKGSAFGKQIPSSCL